jgi:hypothetical protein
LSLSLCSMYFSSLSTMQFAFDTVTPLLLNNYTTILFSALEAYNLYVPLYVSPLSLSVCVCVFHIHIKVESPLLS